MGIRQQISVFERWTIVRLHFAYCADNLYAIPHGHVDFERQTGTACANVFVLWVIH